MGSLGGTRQQPRRLRRTRSAASAPSSAAHPRQPRRDVAVQRASLRYGEAIFDPAWSLGAAVVVEGRLFIPQGRTYFRSIAAAVRTNPRPRVAPIDVDTPERSFSARFIVGMNVDGDAPIDVFTLLAIDVRRSGRDGAMW